MIRLRLMAALLLITVFLTASCGGNGAQELFDTARLEERQNNPEHALSLYKEIVEKYPSSDAAKEARVRIETLQKGK